MARGGGIYPRGQRLWIWWMQGGRRQARSTGLRVGQERDAERILQAVLARVEAAEETGIDPETATLSEWAAEWIRRRRARGIKSVGDEDAHLREHVLPVLGSVRLRDLRPRRIRSLVHALREDPQLAPKTVRNIYGTLRSCMTEAVVEDLLDATPCVLLPGDLPPQKDKDPTWRATAIYSAAEIERLISDVELYQDRRVVYALLALAGLRWGEMAALRWMDYDATVEPLGRLTVARSYSAKRKNVGSTKTDSTRLVPVHSALASVLAEWRMGGWGEMMGRAPGPEDLIAPSQKGTPRSPNVGLRSLHRDLATLGLRPRRAHDLRRAFISLARAGGASKDLVAMITHTPRGADVIDGYTSLEWAALCRIVEGIQVTRRPPEGAEVTHLSCYSPATGAEERHLSKEKAP